MTIDEVIVIINRELAQLKADSVTSLQSEEAIIDFGGPFAKISKAITNNSERDMFLPILVKDTFNSVLPTYGNVWNPGEIYNIHFMRNELQAENSRATPYVRVEGRRDDRFRRDLSFLLDVFFLGSIALSDSTANRNRFHSNLADSLFPKASKEPTVAQQTATTGANAATLDNPGNSLQLARRVSFIQGRQFGAIIHVYIEGAPDYSMLLMYLFTGNAATSHWTTAVNWQRMFDIGQYDTYTAPASLLQSFPKWNKGEIVSLRSKNFRGMKKENTHLKIASRDILYRIVNPPTGYVRRTDIQNILSGLFISSIEKNNTNNTFYNHPVAADLASLSTANGKANGIIRFHHNPVGGEQLNSFYLYVNTAAITNARLRAPANWVHLFDVTLEQQQAYRLHHLIRDVVKDNPWKWNEYITLDTGINTFHIGIKPKRSLDLHTPREYIEAQDLLIVLQRELDNESQEESELGLKQQKRNYETTFTSLKGSNVTTSPLSVTRINTSTSPFGIGWINLTGTGAPTGNVLEWRNDHGNITLVEALIPDLNSFNLPIPAITKNALESRIQDITINTLTPLQSLSNYLVTRLPEDSEGNIQESGTEWVNFNRVEDLIEVVVELVSNIQTLIDVAELLDPNSENGINALITAKEAEIIIQNNLVNSIGNTIPINENLSRYLQTLYLGAFTRGNPTLNFYAPLVTRSTSSGTAAARALRDGNMLVSRIPVSQRKLGAIVSFFDPDNPYAFMLYRYTHATLLTDAEWGRSTNWNRLNQVDYNTEWLRFIQSIPSTFEDKPLTWHENDTFHLLDEYVKTETIVDEDEDGNAITTTLEYTNPRVFIKAIEEICFQFVDIVLQDRPVIEWSGMSGGLNQSNIRTLIDQKRLIQMDVQTFKGGNHVRGSLYEGWRAANNEDRPNNITNEEWNEHPIKNNGVVEHNEFYRCVESSKENPWTGLDVASSGRRLEIPRLKNLETSFEFDSIAISFEEHYIVSDISSFAFTEQLNFHWERMKGDMAPIGSIITNIDNGDQYKLLWSSTSSLFPYWSYITYAPGIVSTSPQLIGQLDVSDVKIFPSSFPLHMRTKQPVYPVYKRILFFNNLNPRDIANNPLPWIKGDRVLYYFEDQPKFNPAYIIKMNVDITRNPGRRGSSAPVRLSREPFLQNPTNVGVGTGGSNTNRPFPRIIFYNRIEELNASQRFSPANPLMLPKQRDPSSLERRNRLVCLAPGSSVQYLSVSSVVVTMEYICDE
jgi:hypothetical protein